MLRCLLGAAKIKTNRTLFYIHYIILYKHFSFGANFAFIHQKPLFGPLRRQGRRESIERSVIDLINSSFSIFGQTAAETPSNERRREQMSEQKLKNHSSVQIRCFLRNVNIRQLAFGSAPASGRMSVHCLHALCHAITHLLLCFFFIIFLPGRAIHSEKKESGIFYFVQSRKII